MEPKRIVIYAKDIEKIIGISGRTARKLMSAIRKKLGKEKHQFISLDEFSAYTGISMREIMKCLNIN